MSSGSRDKSIHQYIAENERYPDCNGGMVDLAIRCVSEEFKLMDTFVDKQRQCDEIQQANQKIELNLEHMEQTKTRLDEEIKCLASMVSTLSSEFDTLEENQEHFKDFQTVSSYLPKRNGTMPSETHLSEQLQQNEATIQNLTEQIKSQHKRILETLTKCHTKTSELVSLLELKVQEWKWQFQLDYAELAASADLKTKLAPWCARTGSILYDILHKSMVSWQNSVRSLPVEGCESMVEECCNVEESYTQIMTRLIKRTFVMTEQGNFFIKTGNKRFPKFCVRVLAVDYLSKLSFETTAHFVSEEDLQRCWKKTDLELKKLLQVERKLKNNKLKFTVDRDKMECCFQNLQFEQPFKRPQKDQTRQVHEEKYRVVFVTKLEKTTYWTLSLPLVVTTASNQEAHSLASIMWQCFSTDVFNPLSDMPDALPWSKVAEMLQQKMARVSPKHRLSSENFTHMKNRLFGEEGMSDHTPVSLTRFCWNTMEDTDFSFWKWFLGIYNLIEQYLEPFWNDGLIMGFVKKEEAEKMLESSEAGEFILRFSDKLFTNSDGRKSVYGRLTSCVVVMEEAKGGKRNCLGQPESVKRKVVEHVDVADFKKLGGEFKKLDNDERKRNNLASILKETWIKPGDGSPQVHMYQCLYPSHKTREELFDKYCEDCNSVSGYRNTREAYIAILEQTMSKVKAKKEAKMSSESSLQSGSAKRARRANSNTRSIRQSPKASSSQSSISSSHGSPFNDQLSYTTSQSPVYPATPSPLNPLSIQTHSYLDLEAKFQTHANIDNLGLITDQSLLPTVVQYPEFQETFPMETRAVQTIPPSGEQTEIITSPNAMAELTSNFESRDSSAGIGVSIQNFTHQSFKNQDSAGLTVGSGACLPELVHSGQITIDEVTDSENTHQNENMNVEETLIVIHNGNEFELKTIPASEESLPSRRQQALDYLSSTLSQEQFHQVRQWVEESEASITPSTGDMVVTNISCPLVSTPVSSDDWFSFSGNQFPGIGSGDIDTNFVQSFTEPETGGIN